MRRLCPFLCAALYAVYLELCAFFQNEPVPIRPALLTLAGPSMGGLFYSLSAHVSCASYLFCVRWQRRYIQYFVTPSTLPLCVPRTALANFCLSEIDSAFNRTEYCVKSTDLPCFSFLPLRIPAQIDSFISMRYRVNHAAIFKLPAYELLMLHSFPITNIYKNVTRTSSFMSFSFLQVFRT